MEVDMPLSGREMKQECKNCGSQIDHFGFTPTDAAYILEVGTLDAFETFMKTIGGTCPKCRRVTCANCYHHNTPQYTCPNCGAKIPDLVAPSSR